MVKEFAFCWGEPYCVREALKAHYKRKTMRPINFDTMCYAPDGGQDALVKLTKQYLKETTDIDYKHVIITNGTTGALNVVLRALKRKKCYTHKYHFPYYDDIIVKNGYKHYEGLYREHEKQLDNSDTLAIVDSPSNPLGDLLLYGDINNNIIWDSVYHNKVFINGIPVKPDHRVNCGSYSKVFGLTGVRVGYIATNNDEDYKLYLKENTMESCTISAPSQEFIVDIFDHTDLDNFMRSAKYRINNNREMFDRVCYMFDGQAVPDNGMFFTAWASPYTSKLLDKLGFSSVQMDTMGKDRFLRFNLAQTNDITNKAIRYLLKEDGK